MITHTSTVETKLKVKNEFINNHITEQFTNYYNQCKKLEILKCLKSNRIRSEKIVTEHTVNLQNKLQPLISNNTELITEQQSKIKSLNIVIGNHENEIEN